MSNSAVALIACAALAVHPAAARAQEAPRAADVARAGDEIAREAAARFTTALEDGALRELIEDPPPRDRQDDVLREIVGDTVGARLTGFTLRDPMMEHRRSWRPILPHEVVARPPRPVVSVALAAPEISASGERPVERCVACDATLSSAEPATVSVSAIALDVGTRLGALRDCYRPELVVDRRTCVETAAKALR